MNTKVGLAQVVLVMLIGRIIVIFTAAVSGGYTEAEMLSVMLGLPLIFALGIPVILFCRKHRQKLGLLEGANALGGSASKIICVVYAAYFFLIGVIGVGKFDFFFGHIMPSMTYHISVAVIILVPTLYAMCKGLEAILRAGSILAVVCLAALILTVGALVPHMEVAYLNSPYLSDPERVLMGVITFVVQTPEIAAFGVLAPCIRGSVRRGYQIFCLLAAGAIFAMVTVTIGVLGNYGAVTKFPFYTATGVFQLGSFQNLEALQVGVWTLGGFLKASFYLWLCRYCLQRAFPVFQKFLPTCGLAVVAALCASAYAGNESRFPVSVLALALALAAVVIPVILLISNSSKKGEITA